MKFCQHSPIFINFLLPSTFNIRQLSTFISFIHSTTSDIHQHPTFSNSQYSFTSFSYISFLIPLFVSFPLISKIGAFLQLIRTAQPSELSKRLFQEALTRHIFWQELFRIDYCQFPGNIPFPNNKTASSNFLLKVYSQSSRRRILLRNSLGKFLKGTFLLRYSQRPGPRSASSWLNNLLIAKCAVNL